MQSSDLEKEKGKKKGKVETIEAREEGKEEGRTTLHGKSYSFPEKGSGDSGRKKKYDRSIVQRGKIIGGPRGH